MVTSTSGNGAWSRRLGSLFRCAYKWSLERYAQLIGVPRGYGYGATMGAWVIDYLANWGGETGFVTHCDARYIGPAFVGDATFLTGRVTKKDSNPHGGGVVTVDFEMKNQNGMLMAKGPAEIVLPK